MITSSGPPPCSGVFLVVTALLRTSSAIFASSGFKSEVSVGSSGISIGDGARRGATASACLVNINLRE